MSRLILASGLSGSALKQGTEGNRFDKRKTQMTEPALHTVNLPYTRDLENKINSEKFNIKSPKGVFGTDFYLAVAADYALGRAKEYGGKAIIMFLDYPTCLLEGVKYNLDDTPQGHYSEIIPAIFNIHSLYEVKNAERYKKEKAHDPNYLKSFTLKRLGH